MRDVFHDTMHGPREQNLVFIVQCNDNEQLGGSWLFIEDLTQGELFLLEVCRITCCSGISHMSEFPIFLVGQGV